MADMAAERISESPKGHRPVQYFLNCLSGLENKGRPHLSTPRALALSESPPPSQNETCKRIRRNGSPRGVTHSIGAQASALSVK